MSTIKNIAKNSGIFLFGNIMNYVLDLVVLVYLSRYLGITGYGIYTFVFTYIFFFGILANLGIQKILIRELATQKKDAGKIVGNAIIIKFILSTIAILLSLLIINILNYPQETRILVYFASLTLLFLALEDSFSAYFLSTLEAKYAIASSISGKVVSTALVLGIIYFKMDLLYIVISFIISSIVYLYVSFRFSQKFFKLELKWDTIIIKRLFKSSIPLAITQVLGVIYYRIDVIMLSLMKTFSDVGLYAAAYKITEAMNIIPLAIGQSIFPLMSKYHLTSKESLAELYERSILIVMIIGLPIAIGTTVLSEKIILLIYGQKFLFSATALSILVWAEFMIFFRPTLNNIVIAMNKEKIIPYIAGAMAVLNVIMNLLIIPKYGYLGASVTTFITQFMEIACFYYYANNNLLKISIGRPILKIVFINMLLLIVIVILNMFISLFPIIFISILVYAIMVYYSGILTANELDLFKNILKKVRH